MLQNLRNASQSWLIRGLFAVLIVCFVVLWGAGDMLRPSGDGKNQIVATIGSRKISQFDLEKAFKREIVQLQLTTGKEIDVEKARKIGVMSSTLQRLLTENLLDLEADHLGLTVSDAQIRQSIQKNPAFQDEGQAFDKDRFVRYLEIFHMNEKDYVRKLRGELTREQLIRALVAGVHPPLIMVKPLYVWQYEKRLVDTALIKPQDMRGIGAPSDQDLKTYYEAHQAAFEAPENRDFTVVVISRQDLEDTLVLADKEISEGFDARRDEMKGGLPSRHESERITKELRKEKAYALMLELTNKIEDALAEGATLEELAKKFDVKAIKLKKVEKEGKLDAALNKGTLAPDVLDAIRKEGFANEAGADSLLTEAGNGTYVLVRVDHITPTAVKPFEAVKTEATAAWRLEKQAVASQDLAERLQKTVNDGVPLTQAAMKDKIKVSANVVVSRMNNAKDMGIPSGIKNKIFAAAVKKAEFGRSDGGYLVVQTKEIIPAKIDVQSKEFKDFEERIGSMLANDILDQYIFALEKKFRVEVNERALASEEKQAERN